LGDGGPWQVEGELGLSAEEQLSLQRASALQPGSAPQPLSAGLEGQLGDKPIVALSMIPEGRVGAERLLASLGQPRLRLQLAQGEAWVYPQLGLTAHLPDDDLRLMLAVPRQALEKPPR
ncbi:hypothetical protein HKT27_38880, partial [Pseudomonas aeruginosa]|nr:hypothetical protein [Pseudomonas aeruginosa]MBF3263660.1 hypothetical protein [Pseudomonas aeruginosa]